MTEERDKAVEEALKQIAREDRHTCPDNVVEWEGCEYNTMLCGAVWLWQRAQEAERKACANAMCSQCAQGRPFDPEGVYHLFEDTSGWLHRVGCLARPIRNRSAASAPEESKPCPQCGAERCLGGAH